MTIGRQSCAVALASCLFEWTGEKLRPGTEMNWINASYFFVCQGFDNQLQLLRSIESGNDGFECYKLVPHCVEYRSKHKREESLRSTGI